MRAAAIRTSSTVIMMRSPVVEKDGLAASHTVAEHVEATELWSRTDGWCGVANGTILWELLIWSVHQIR